MTKITSSLFIATLLGLFLHVATAQAQLVRTCVSMAKGNDANSSSFCHCTTPCRTFATAHNNTLPDGEITVLDPGDYGGLTITKSISINNDSGGEASITVSGFTTGIIVNAPSGGYVNLRGLTIQGVGFGLGTGLRFNTGFALTVTNCVIRNLTGNGIEFLSSSNSHLSVSNTLVADNGGSGILVQPGAGANAQTVLSRVKAYNNSVSGIRIQTGSGSTSTGTIKAIATDSVAANNGAAGFHLDSSAGFVISDFMVVRSVAANNGTGIAVGSGTATLRVGQSTVTGNATSTVGVSSYGDNYINGNGDGDPAPATIAKK